MESAIGNMLSRGQREALERVGRKSKKQRKKEAKRQWAANRERRIAKAAAEREVKVCIKAKVKFKPQYRGRSWRSERSQATISEREVG